MSVTLTVTGPSREPLVINYPYMEQALAVSMFIDTWNSKVTECKDKLTVVAVTTDSSKPATEH